MKSIANDQLLDLLTEQVEWVLDKAIREWQLLPASIMTQKPGPEGWSAAQCLDHLNGYGDYYLPLLEKAVSLAQTKGRSGAQFKPGWLGDYFARLMEPGNNGMPIKTMKAPKQNTPPAYVDAASAVSLFIEQQERLILLLRRAHHLDLNSRDIPISIMKMIKLKTGDVFRFLVAHIRRHVAQAERAITAAGQLGIAA